MTDDLHNYAVDITIEVSAKIPEEAAQQAWSLMTQPDSFLPVATVHTEKGHAHTVDLEDIGLGEYA